MAMVPRKWELPLADGIYLNLPAEQLPGTEGPSYFGQEARGSSDWVKLRRQRWGWWWQSPYNPDFKPQANGALDYGTALHAILLEGLAAYEGRFVVEPDKAEFDGLLVTIDDMRERLTDEGFKPASGWPSSWKKEDFCRACRVNMPGVPVWQNLIDDFNDRLAPGVKAISAVEDRELRFMREVAVGRWPGNERIRRLLVESPDHPPLAEVSMFATVDGIRRRWRWDRMYPAFDLDLKSLGNWTGRPLPYAVGDQLAKLGWPIQRADYFEGRRLMYGMLQAYGVDCIHGGTLEQRRWLVEWPDRFPVWDWVWLVYQKPAASGRAPVIFPVWDDSFVRSCSGELEPSFLRKVGLHQLNDAIAFYKATVAQFGLDQPWAHVEPLHYTDEPLEPRISLPHWVGEDMPTEQAAYA